MLPATIQPTSLTSRGVLPGRWEWCCPYGLSRLVVDTTTFDFHVDASPEALSQGLAEVMDLMHHYGFEPMPEDESPAELLDDDWVRVYFVPIVALDDSPLIRTTAVV